MLNKKFTLVATLMATLVAGSVMAEQKADKKFVDDSSYAVGVINSVQNMQKQLA